MNALKTTLRLVLITTVAAGVFVLHDSPAAASGSPAWSWNLSHDMLVDVVPNPNSLVTNPSLNNAWTFLEGASPWSPPRSSTLLSGGRANGSCWGVPSLTCWVDPSTSPNQRDSAMVAMSTSTVTVQNGGCSVQLTKGVPILHPGPNTDVIVRWTNPLSHAIQIQILGRFTNSDPCGPYDGVDWTVYDQWGPLVSSPQPLVSTWSPFLLDSDLFYVPPLIVSPGDSIDFVVHRKSDYYYDGTELDVLIVGQ